MATIDYIDGNAVAKPCTLNLGETVLGGLERCGVAVPNSCRSGVCQSCLMRAGAGPVPPAAQKGLKDSLRAQNYFLACVCTPIGDMTIYSGDQALKRVRAVVRQVEKLNRDVIRIRLECESPFEYFSGQFVSLKRADGLMRSYSLAGLRSDSPSSAADCLEIHVGKVAGGAMSSWLHDVATPGEWMNVYGPMGDCFYTPGRPDQPLLLAATGTGLAPLWAIARDALRQGHYGPIRLYHASRDSGGHYLVEELQKIAAANPNFTYTRCIKQGQAFAGVRVGLLEDAVIEDVPRFAGWRAFLCGNPDFVGSMRKKIFLRGAAMKDINSDAFVRRKMTSETAGPGSPASVT